MPFVDDPSHLQLLWFAGAIFLAGLIHGTLGLGFPLVATPLLALVVDVQSAIMITLLPTVAVNIASIIKGGRWSESVGRFWPLALCAVIGSVLGTHLLILSDPAPFKLLLAILVMLYLWVSNSKTLKMGWLNDRPLSAMMIFGLIAGFAAGTTNVMVPILIIYTLELALPPTVMVQTFNLSFLGGKLSQILVFAASGLLTTKLLITTTPLAVVALMGLTLGMFMRGKISTEVYRRIVKRVLLVLAVLLITQYFLS
ncbi:MAG: sulfite exporter TauE/SafE family protein [Gammaproteobacteria bacterium]|nr:sulfite exporter TauE/SafE family protein [Gammaproteobacteria bacterium]